MVIVLFSQYSPIGIIPTAKARHCKLEMLEAHCGRGGGDIQEGKGLGRGGGGGGGGGLCRNGRAAAFLKRWCFAKALH